jgi:F-type H+-transporting ATPase subunit delta
MNYSAIASRYSKALFTLAKEKNILSDIHNDMELIVSVCDNEQYFNQFLENPVLALSKKTDIFNKIFKGKTNQVTLNFLALVAKNRREPFLRHMAINFLNLYKDFKGIKTIQFSSVAKISDTVRKEIEQIVKTSFNAETELLEKIDENLIGGFVIRIDDEQYDASVANQLEKIKREIVKN